MSSYVTRKTPGDTAWFTHDRFGMFIHWGLYAMPARHEWVKNREKTPEEHYDLYFKYFRPGSVRPEGVGQTGQSGWNEVCGYDHKAS